MPHSDFSGSDPDHMAKEKAVISSKRFDWIGLCAELREASIAAFFVIPKSPALQVPKVTCVPF